MARNGSGTYNRIAGTPYVYNTVIDETVVNGEMDDIATALTQSIAKDGQTTPTADLPMGTYKHTGVGAATARTQYARAAEVQDGSITHLTSVSGADTITASAPLSMSAYATGQKFSFVSAGANTGAATLNINSIGAKSITKNGTTALAAGDIPSGAAVEVIYDGTQFQLIGVNYAARGDIASSGLTGYAAQGQQTIWIPAGAMTARTTNGAASGTAETTTNKVMLKTLDFDASTAEYAQFSVRMPKSWNEGTVTAYFLWSNASGTGDVVWGLQGVALSDDDALDAAFGTAQTVTDSVTAAGDLMQSAATSAITIGGTPAAGDWVVFQAYRDAASGSDTLASDARLHGVVVIYTTDAANDA